MIQLQVQKLLSKLVQLRAFPKATLCLLIGLTVAAFPPMANAQTVVRVDVCTGGEGLSGMNTAFIRMGFADGGQEEQVLSRVLTGGTCANNLNIEFSRTFTALDVVSITIRYERTHSGYPFDIFDSWEMRSLAVRMDTTTLYNSTADSRFSMGTGIRFNSENSLFGLNLGSLDLDLDGIPDRWEREGHGPLNPAIHNVRVGRADLILVLTRRPDLSSEQAAETLREVKDFYARVPNHNFDGTTGINVIVVDGPTLPASDLGTDYTALYEIGMPVGWRGIAHGHLLGSDSGGGGQAIRVGSDWSTSGNFWQAVSHEIGHQLGIDHTPPGSGLSPLWPSIMNYTYTDSFNGDPNAVRFSTGAFASTILNATRLSEILPYPIDSLQFLGQSPNFFSLQAIDARSTSVDWNRNGIFRETLVSANITDGYSVIGVTPSIIGGATSGTPSMTQIGSKLYLVYPVIAGTPSTWNQTNAPSLSQLVLQELNGEAFSTPVDLTIPNVLGGASVVGMGNRLVVAYVNATDPSTSGQPTVAMWDTTRGFKSRGTKPAVDSSQQVHQAVITSGTLSESGKPVPISWLITWNKDTKTIRITDVIDDGAKRPRPRISGKSYEIQITGEALRSDHQIGAAFDSLTRKLILATYERQWDQDNKIRITTLRRSGGRWVYESHRYAGTASSGWWGNTAPQVVLDRNTPIAGHSRITVYIRGGADDNALTQTYRLQEIADRTQDDGWRTRIMIDEWNTAQSPPAAALYNGHHAFALRWRHADDSIPNAVVFYRQTGIIDEPLRDFDDVTFIANRGLRDSLVGIRRHFGISEP
ncbi:MAG TPA: M12 family metallo-peptidase [Nitrospira sp.]|nr:M12 family metallo-peptidase [Nitrospira sp.]